MDTPIASIRDAVERIIVEGRDNTPDPIERAQWFQTAIDELGDRTTELLAARRAAVYEARQSMSAVDVAEALGITRARVYQILDGR